MECRGNDGISGWNTSVAQQMSNVDHDVPERLAFGRKQVAMDAAFIRP